MDETALIPLGRLLAITSKAVRERADQALLAHDASLTTWIVLRHAALADGIEGLSQRQLADSLGIGSPALVRHLDRLEAKGYVQRRRDTTDRRITRITLTPEGDKVRRHLEQVMAGQDTTMRALLTTQEVRVLTRALTKLHDYALTPPTTGIDP